MPMAKFMTDHMPFLTMCRCTPLWLAGAIRGQWGLMSVTDALSDQLICLPMWIGRNYSGLNQYFPRNALFLPPKGEGIARFALEKWMA